MSGAGINKENTVMAELNVREAVFPICIDHNETGRPVVQRGMGFFVTVYYLGMAILPPIAGLLQDRTGNATASVLLGSILMGLTILPLLAFRLLQWRLSPKDNSATENRIRG